MHLQLNQRQQRKRWRILLALCVQFVLLSQALPAANAAGATWYVATTGSDANTCLEATAACLSVQAAIGKATDGDTISIAPGVYTTNIQISKLLTLVGAGAGVTVLDGGKIDRVVVIGPNVTVSIIGLTIRNGQTGSTPAANVGGGGILNQGILTLLSVAVELNRSITKDGFERHGGGIFNQQTLTLVNSSVNDNAAVNADNVSTAGGGILNQGQLIVTGSRIDNNTGGGISNGNNPSNTITVVNSAISNNIKKFGGGGISNVYGNVSITASTISGNVAQIGGAISHVLGRITVVNSTLSNNISNEDGGAIYFGGGQIFPEDLAELEISDSTISGNRTTNRGGGLYVGDRRQKTSLRNTIIAGNSAATAPDCIHADTIVNAAITSHGFNLIGDGSGCTMTPNATDLIGVAGDPIDPLLSALQNNGGPTRTRAPRPGSLAIDNGPPTCSATDQRGTPRPIGLSCDIGAYEANAVTPPSLDFIPDRLEVTQAVQDLNNSVRLVAGKRTFVRFHVRATSQAAAHAELLVSRNGQQLRLQPISRIRARTAPDRATVGHALLFELPSEFTSGTVSLTGEINPAVNWASRVPEIDFTNNIISTQVSFEDVPPIDVYIYAVDYRVNGSYHRTLVDELAMLENWLRRAYPISELRVQRRAYFHGDSLPSCGDVNGKLSNIIALDTISNPTPTIPANAHLYGMVTHGGGFMRGCSPTPGRVASGPTGAPDPVNNPANALAWDTDGTYGDWYGGHELAHSYGRNHANFCGPTDGVPYPYPNGEISPAQTGDTALFGFDPGVDGATPTVYPPGAHDVMTYCEQQWVSDFTYEALMDVFRDEGQDGARQLAQPELTDRLVVIGSINLKSGKASLQPLFVIPNAGEVRPRVPGTYAIVLRNAQNALLARYPFTPQELEDTDGLLFVNEQVPFVAGTTSVTIEGPGGVVFAQVRASAAPPTVALTVPNGGETLVGNTITVAWTASDPNNEPLTFTVQYSRDNGANWETVAQSVTGRSVTIDARNIAATPQGRFRVLASDGINTAGDTSDAPFSVPNRPPTVAIVEPAHNTTIAAGQTLALVGTAYDGDSGSLPADQLQWLSSIDGSLGRGSHLSTARLSVGVHTITFKADDQAGAVASDTVQVTVVRDPSQLAATPNKLIVDPASIELNAAGGPTSASITIDNQNWLNPIAWNATASAPWVVLSAASGHTPDELGVTLDPALLPAGTHDATITLTSPDSPGDSVTISVRGSRPGPAPIVVGEGAPQSCTAARLHSALQEARDTHVYRVAFNCGRAPHTITLDKTEVIGSDMEVDGGGTITLSGADKVRIFEVCSPSGGGAADFTLSLRGLTLTHGRSDPNRAGGAITNYGCRVSIANSTFSRNTAVFEAGAINNLFGGTLTIHDSTFSGNQATTNAGVISAQTGQVTVVNSTFSGNTAGANGGAIFASAGATLSIAGSTFTGNRAGAAGGAVVAGHASLATTISDSQFANNVAGTVAGALGAATAAPFVVRDVSFTSNSAGISGGAISSGAALDVRGASFTGNSATANGGAIQTTLGSLALTNASFSGNSANGVGGAIFNTTPLTLSQVAFVSNTARGGGGAIRSDGATSIDDARFSANGTHNGSGGAILNSAALDITRATFDRNQAARDNGDPHPSAAHGGAIADEQAEVVTVSNSTFWENSASGDGEAIYHRADSQAGRLVNVTVASSGGSGIAGPLTISNSLLVSSGGANCTGAITTTGPNLEFPGSSCGASIKDVDPLLDDGLKANGGSTATVALRPGSPAIGAGDNGICAASPVSNLDQRRQPRPAGSRCDLGAYEAQP